jgi:hypothetical protein
VLHAAAPLLSRGNDPVAKTDGDEKNGPADK